MSTATVTRKRPKTARNVTNKKAISKKSSLKEGEVKNEDDLQGVRFGTEGDEIEEELNVSKKENFEDDPC